MLLNTYLYIFLSLLVSRFSKVVFWRFVSITPREAKLKKKERKKERGKDFLKSHLPIFFPSRPVLRALVKHLGPRVPGRGSWRKLCPCSPTFRLEAPALPGYGQRQLATSGQLNHWLRWKKFFVFLLLEVVRFYVGCGLRYLIRMVHGYSEY